MLYSSDILKKAVWINHASPNILCSHGTKNKNLYSFDDLPLFSSPGHIIPHFPRIVGALFCMGATHQLFFCLEHLSSLCTCPSHPSVFNSDPPPWGHLSLLTHSTPFIAFTAHISNWNYRLICQIPSLIIVCDCHGGPGPCPFIYHRIPLSRMALGIKVLLNIYLLIGEYVAGPI